MLDVDKQVVHWRDGAAEDWEVAAHLVSRNKYRHGLFFAHLALEKTLKAHVCLHTQQIPPRIHNLLRLAELAGLSLDQNQNDVLADMNRFCLEGRYPDNPIPVPPEDRILDYMARAKELLTCLIQPLQQV